MTLNKMQTEMCKSSKWNFSDLQALFLNCTLKRSPDISHTQGLIDISQAIMEKMGVSVEVLRPVEYNIAYGVWPDMKEHGWEKDDWPEIYEKVKAAHILVITSPIWLGEKSSVGTKVIERLYSTSGDLNEHGQYAYYGRVGGCLITGNEDGASYLDPGSGGPENDFTNRNTTFMTWNLMHLARMIKDVGGIPAHGNQRSKWEAGCRFDYPNPEYR
jgi:multimeric flavodoxin WrbA